MGDSHYGVRTLLNGTVLPGPDIGMRGARIMRGVRDLGFECGIHCYDHVRWQDGVMQADAAWTQREMARACDRFHEIFGEAARTHGAAGWQMNAEALRLTQQLGFDYCSDGRGTGGHLPVWNAELIRCPQFPTTLPTLDEIIGVDGLTAENVAGALLARTAEGSGDHVFTLHAELEGMKLAPVMEQLLIGWKAQGYRLVPVRALYEAVEPMALPRCTVAPGTIPGRTGTLLVQGAEFLADQDIHAR